MIESKIFMVDIDHPGGCKGWVHVSNPMEDQDGVYYCMVCSDLFKSPQYKIYGIDGGQACTLAIEFAIKLIHDIIRPYDVKVLE